MQVEWTGLHHLFSAALPAGCRPTMRPGVLQGLEQDVADGQAQVSAAVLLQ